MRKLLVIPLGFVLMGAGLAAGLACGKSVPAETSSSAVGPTRSGEEEFVTALGFSCDRERWRVGFDLSKAAQVSGRVERRLSRSPDRWMLVRRLALRRMAAGPRAIDLEPSRSGVYRVTLAFRAADGTAARPLIVFRAGCENPPPPTTTPTLPGTTGTLPVQ